MKNVVELSKGYVSPATFSSFEFALAEAPSTESNTNTDHVSGVTTTLTCGSNMGDSSKTQDLISGNANYSFVTYDWFRTGATGTSANTPRMGRLCFS